MQATAVPPPLTRYGAILTVVLSGIAALAIGFAYFNRPDAGTSAPASAMQKTAMASQIEYLAESAQLQAQAIAAHPQTLACFEAGNGEACRSQSANLHALNRQATLDFVKEGNNANLLPGFLPDGTRRLLERAARHNSSATTADFSLTVTQPVFNAQKQRVGFVILEQGVPQLQAMFDTLPLPAAGAYIELLQSQEGQAASTLMRRGNQALKNGPPVAEVALTGTPWKIVVWRNRPPGFQVALPYLFAWVLLTLAIAVIVMAVMMRMSRKVYSNLKTMARMVNDMRSNKLQPEYPVGFAEFVQPMRYMLKIAHAQVGEQKKVTNEATFDHLSKVHNRRSFELKQSEIFKTLRDGWSHSLLLLDIDNFKQINDTYGHEAGDQMIVAFGRVLRENLRSSDFIARLGGDEFCVLFPFTTLERAEDLAERLRASMPQSVELIPGVIQKLGWSGGLSEYSRDDVQENMALSRADAALLEAKRDGRNNTKVKVAA
jgi:diguanylate cyclase (GGDEF)-like protein